MNEKYRDAILRLADGTSHLSLLATKVLLDTSNLEDWQRVSLTRNWRPTFWAQQDEHIKVKLVHIEKVIRSMLYTSEEIALNSHWNIELKK